MTFLHELDDGITLFRPPSISQNLKKRIRSEYLDILIVRDLQLRKSYF